MPIANRWQLLITVAAILVQVATMNFCEMMFGRTAAFHLVNVAMCATCIWVILRAERWAERLVRGK
jgi:hypothetical protein